MKRDWVMHNKYGLDLRPTQLRLGHTSSFVNRGFARQTLRQATVIQLPIRLPLDPHSLFFFSRKVCQCQKTQG